MTKLGIGVAMVSYVLLVRRPRRIMDIGKREKSRI